VFLALLDVFIKKKKVVNSSKIKFVSKRKNKEREGVVWQGASPTFDDFEQAGLQGDDFYSVMQPMPFHLKIKKKKLKIILLITLSTHALQRTEMVEHLVR
jgi:hypothetical protein